MFSKYFFPLGTRIHKIFLGLFHFIEDDRLHRSWQDHGIFFCQTDALWKNGHGRFSLGTVPFSGLEFLYTTKSV